MSRIRALVVGAGLLVTASVGGATVWFAGSMSEPAQPSAARDLALAGATGSAEADVVSAVERGLVAPRARTSSERGRPPVARPEPIAETPVLPAIAEPIEEAVAPPVAEPEPVTVPEPAPVTVALAAAPASSGAVGITALEPGETVSVAAGWNGANAAEPELPVIRANMPAVRLGGIGGGQCGGRRGGGTLVLR